MSKAVHCPCLAGWLHGTAQWGAEVQPAPRQVLQPSHCSAWAEGDIRFHLLLGTQRDLFISYLYFLPSLHGSRTLCHLGTNHNISFALLSPSLAQTLLFTKTEQS